jgi:hypothetical protein
LFISIERALARELFNMKRLEIIAIVPGLFCMACGAWLILSRNSIAYGAWFGSAILASSTLLVGIGLFAMRRKPGPQDVGYIDDEVPKPIGAWFPIGMAVIFALQFAYLIWWKIYSKN